MTSKGDKAESNGSMGGVVEAIAIASSLSLCISVIFQVVYFVSLGYPVVITHLTLSDYLDSSSIAVLCIAFPLAMLFLYATTLPLEKLKRGGQPEDNRKFKRFIYIAGWSMLIFQGAFAVITQLDVLAPGFLILASSLLIVGYLAPGSIPENLDTDPEVKQSYRLRAGAVTISSFLLIAIFTASIAGTYKKECPSVVKVSLKEGQKDLTAILISKLGGELAAVDPKQKDELIWIPSDNIGRYSISGANCHAWQQL